MDFDVDFDHIEVASKSEVKQALDTKRIGYEAELRKEYRQQGFEYKSNSQVIGTGNTVDPMVYKIRKYILFHLIANPHLAKRGAFKKVWDTEYSHVMPYNQNVTNKDIWKPDRREIIDKLKEHGMYKRISFKRVGTIITLIQQQHEANSLRREIGELRDMLSMYREGTSIVINNVVYRGDANYYYLPDKSGKQQRVRKGTFSKAFDIAIEYGLITDEVTECKSQNSFSLDSLAMNAS